MKNISVFTFFIIFVANLFAFSNHSFITSRIPVILYNDGSAMGSTRIKEIAAITETYILVSVCID